MTHTRSLSHPSPFTPVKLTRAVSLGVRKLSLPVILVSCANNAFSVGFTGIKRSERFLVLRIINSIAFYNAPMSCTLIKFKDAFIFLKQHTINGVKKTMTTRIGFCVCWNTYLMERKKILIEITKKKSKARENDTCGLKEERKCCSLSNKSRKVHSKKKGPRVGFHYQKPDIGTGEEGFATTILSLKEPCCSRHHFPLEVGNIRCSIS